ncbi:MAG TPA: flagellar hook basal-body protein [Planctomycetota bacterium]|nr:flagellar hook basal-body protein [Planctomycetota bacterium]
MLEGMFLAAAGGRVQSERIDVIGLNLSKMTDTGYKADYAAVQAEAVRGLGTERPGRLVTSPDFADGAPVKTGRALDVALVGEGFLQARGPHGTYYTRSGNLHIDSDKQLALGSGLKVLSDGGEPISISPDSEVEIDSSGNVVQGGAVVAKLGLVKFADPHRDLVRRDGHFAAANDAVTPEEASCRVSAGMRESSNVSAIRAMVEMIESSRAFEACMRMIRYQDATLGKLIGEVGSVSG